MTLLPLLQTSLCYLPIPPSSPLLKKRSTQAGMAQAQSHTARAHSRKHPKPAAAAQPATASHNIPNPNQAHDTTQPASHHHSVASRAPSLPSRPRPSPPPPPPPPLKLATAGATSLQASPEMAATPLLSGEDTTTPLHGVVVIALPDHADGGGRDASRRSEAPAPAALGRAWRLLRLATAPLVVLAAFAVAAHCYGLYSFSFSGEEDWKWGEGRASSFLLPLHPKPKPAAAGVKAAAAERDSTTAVLPERQYYTSVNIGNPARPYFLDIDTGSALTWIQCDAPCTNCTKGPHPLYKPAKENIVPPKDSHCQELQGNQNYCDTCKQCDYEIAYADRSSSAGVLARDNMRLITADGERENMDFVFGCAHDQQGKLLDSPASTDGILGLSNGAMSLPTQLAKQGIISNVFGHCIATDPSSSGYMFLGDDYVPRWGMTWVPVRNGPEDVYSTIVQKVNYGGQELNVREQAGKLTQVIFDSGSSYTYFPHEIYTSLIASLEAVSPGFVHDKSDQTLPFCMKPNFPVRSVDDVKQLFKPLLLHFSKAWLVIPRTFAISPENYLIISDKGNVCLGVLDGTEIGHSSTIVIGDVSLRGKLVAYDNDENQIGWAQSDCSRPQKASMVPFFLSRALRSQLL
uniref:Peptidase A1 domain-containing protein n=2 Tax=Triticum urartu TaxID=4572 RepID=A0A8R7QZG9_TRIUA